MVLTTTHLTLIWGAQHFWVENMYPNHTQAISTQWKQHTWCIKQWSPSQKRTLEDIDASLAILRQ